MADRDDGKSRADQVAALAAERLPGSEIARRLGISRQRVSQIAKAYGIEIRSLYHSAMRDQSQHKERIPVPRLRTGGAYVVKGTSAVGTVSELLVAADLVARGWHVYLPVIRQRGYDLIAYSGDNLLKIEARSGCRKASGVIWFNRESRDSKPTHYAVVITGEPVIYDPDIPESEGSKFHRQTE